MRRTFEVDKCKSCEDAKEQISSLEKELARAREALDFTQTKGEDGCCPFCLGKVIAYKSQPLTEPLAHNGDCPVFERDGGMKPQIGPFFWEPRIPGK